MRFVTALGILLAVAVRGMVAAPDDPVHVQLTMHEGRVSLVARGATLQQILTEWARVGGTAITNQDRLPARAFTLQLVDVPEKEALAVLLEGTAGYVARERLGSIDRVSRFSRLVVMPFSVHTLSASRVRDEFPADDEIHWVRGLAPLPPPSGMRQVREVYPPDDEVHWVRPPASARPPAHAPALAPTACESAQNDC
jgi:hypothetical protein